MDPVALTGLVIAATTMTGTCIKASKNFTEKFAGPSQHSSKELREIISDLHSFEVAIINLQKHVQACEEDQARLQELSNLEEPLQSSMRSLEMIKTRLEDTTFVGKYLRGVGFDNGLKDSLRSLKTGRRLFQDVLQMDIRTISIATEKYVRNIAEDVRDMQSRLQCLDLREHEKNGDEERKILRWLSPLNFVTKQKDILSRRHEDTGAWFLDSPEFQKWLTIPAETLFCPGIPGAGKTVLASISVEHLKNKFDEEGFAVAYIFFSHANKAHQRSEDLVASILEQLMRRKGVTQGLRMLYHRYQAQYIRPEPQEISALLRSTVHEFTRVFVIIDALDECPTTTSSAFIDEIHSLRSVASLLITSRQDKTLEREFHDAIHREIMASNTDLERYVRSKTQQDRRLARYTREDPPLQDKIVAKVVGNASGMFLLVHLQMSSLARQVTKKDMRKALSSLPKELDETYDQNMQRIRSQPAEYVHVAERVLAWVSNAFRPFVVEELQHALAIQPGDTNLDKDSIIAEDDLVSFCVGLVIVDRESRVIRLVHHSTQTYLKDKRSGMDPNIQVHITKACIIYLGFDDFESDEFTNGEGRVVVSDEVRSKYPFLEYAGKYWGHHARGPPQFFLADMIVNFLGRRSRGALACDLIDDTPGYWNFGPLPILTLLVHFGLEYLVDRLGNFDDKHTGLTCAIRYRHDNVVFLLVDRGSYWYDSGANFILAECSSHILEGKENMVILLAKKGVIIDFGVDNGGFLLSMAVLRSVRAAKGDTVPRLLLELGVNGDPQYFYGYTLLMRAVIEGDDFMVRVLLSGGENVNEKNEHGRDALIYAALARDEAVVAPLLDAEADVHSSDEDGMTALCAACIGGNKKIVKMLLDRGAYITAQDRFGRTPLSIATENQNTLLLQLLNGRETGNHLEEEVEADRIAVEDNDEFNAVSKFFATHGDLKSSDNRFIVAVRREAMKYGFDKTLPVFFDAYSKEKDREDDTIFVEGGDTEASESDTWRRQIDRAWRAVKKDTDQYEEQHAVERLISFYRAEPFGQSTL